MQISKINHWKAFSFGLIGVIALVFIGFVAGQRAKAYEDQVLSLQQQVLSVLGYLEFRDNQEFKVTDKLLGEYRNFVKIPPNSPVYLGYIYDLDTKKIVSSTLDETYQAYVNQINDSVAKKINFNDALKVKSNNVCAIQDSSLKVAALDKIPEKNYLLCIKAFPSSSLKSYPSKHSNTHNYLFINALEI